MDEQELSAGLALLDFLDRTAEHCLTSSPEVQPLEPETLRPQDVILFRVDEITYEEEAPWKEALENVMSAARIPGVNFVYLLLGSAAGVQFYYGLSRDYSAPARDNRLTIAELGGSVLKDSLAGNFRGSQVTTVEDQDAILERMRRMKKVARIEGVAGSVKDDERFQSVDRLVDVMQGDPEGPLVRQGEGVGLPPHFHPHPALFQQGGGVVPGRGGKAAGGALGPANVVVAAKVPVEHRAAAGAGPHVLHNVLAAGLLPRLGGDGKIHPGVFRLKGGAHQVVGV